METAAEAEQLWRDQLPFHAAEPEGELVRTMQENAGEIVFRPEVLRHFATGGAYGLVDNRDRLRHCRRPVLVLSGELDRTTPAAAAHRLAQLLPDADEVVIPGAAHMVLDEQPEAALTGTARVPRARARVTRVKRSKARSLRAHAPGASVTAISSMMAGSSIVAGRT